MVVYHTMAYFPAIKKEQTTDIHNLDEPQRNYASKKSQSSKACFLLYNIGEITYLRARELISGCQEQGIEEGE